PERRAVPTETPKSETAEAPSAPPAREHQTPQAIASATASALNTWGWVTLAAGSVGLSVTGGLELVRRNAESNAASTRVQIDKQAALERMDNAMWGARVAGAVGGALLLTSGALWWLGTRDAADSSPGLTASVNPSQSGVEVWL